MSPSSSPAPPLRPIWQGAAGWVAADALYLHHLSAQGRPVMTALPGRPGAPHPPELAPGQNPGGLTPQRLVLLTAFIVAGAAATSLLGLPWWVQVLLGIGAVLAYLVWPALRQMKAIERWASQEDAVTLLLAATGATSTLPGAAGMQRNVTVRTVHPGDSSGQLPDGPEVALVVYGLSSAERVQLVRQILGHQALGRGRQALSKRP